MKKVFVLAAFAGIMSMSACGPSAEEKAAREKFVADSIAQVTADSIAAVEAEQLRIQDSIATAEAIQDSLDAQAAAKNGTKTTRKTTTTTTTTTTEPAKKEGKIDVQGDTGSKKIDVKGESGSKKVKVN